MVDVVPLLRLADVKERPLDHAAADEIERLRSDFSALQSALVGRTGLSAIQEAHKLRKMHPLRNEE